MNFSAEEIKAFKEFVEQLSDSMGNAGCNDMKLKNTPGNVEMLKMVYLSNPDLSPGEAQESITHMLSKKGDLCALDWQVLNYLVNKITKMMQGNAVVFIKGLKNPIGWEDEVSKATEEYQDGVYKLNKQEMNNFQMFKDEQILKHREEGTYDICFSPNGVANSITVTNRTTGDKKDISDINSW